MLLNLQPQLTLFEVYWDLFINSYDDFRYSIGSEQKDLYYVSNNNKRLTFWCVCGSLSLLNSHTHAMRSITHDMLLRHAQIPQLVDLLCTYKQSKVKIILVHILTFHMGEYKATKKENPVLIRVWPTHIFHFGRFFLFVFLFAKIM